MLEVEIATRRLGDAFTTNTAPHIVKEYTNTQSDITHLDQKTHFILIELPFLPGQIWSWQPKLLSSYKLPFCCQQSLSVTQSLTTVAIVTAKNPEARKLRTSVDMLELRLNIEHSLPTGRATPE